MKYLNTHTHVHVKSFGYRYFTKNEQSTTNQPCIFFAPLDPFPCEYKINMVSKLIVLSYLTCPTITKVSDRTSISFIHLQRVSSTNSMRNLSTCRKKNNVSKKGLYCNRYRYIVCILRNWCRYSEVIVLVRPIMNRHLTAFTIISFVTETLVCKFLESETTP